MRYYLENEWLKAAIDSHGSELVSLQNKQTGQEYIWEADPAAWKRHAPVLFPVVGKFRQNCYTWKGKEYQMSQHGFARDSVFTLVRHDQQELWMQLQDSEETRKNYPFAFCLQSGFRLQGHSLEVLWKVDNPGTEPLYFSIGGHPAFAAPTGKNSLSGCTMKFSWEGEQAESTDGLQYRLLDEDGLVGGQLYSRPLQQEQVVLQDELFDRDAWICETLQQGRRLRAVSLEQSGKTWLTVHFQTPLVGIWSAKGKNLPFVCIEPWFGCSDAADFHGELSQRKWGNRLAAGEEFQGGFVIATEEA